MSRSQMKPLAGLARALTAAQRALYSTTDTQTIAGISPQNWPTATQPVQPVGPPGSQPLNWGFWEGINQTITPRPDASLTFQDLRDLATYPLMRLLIEMVKDQVCAISWTVQLRETPGESLKDRRERQKNDANIPRLNEFLRAPDLETPFSDWVRPLLEDAITIDAPAFVMRRTLKGKVFQWRTVDGSEILRLIDDQGYTPLPPSPAYTQLWEGVPRIFLTTDALIYRPKNIVRRGTVASQLYGMSPVEGQAEEIKVGKERLNFTLAYYTDGSVPGLVQMVPPGIKPDKILEAMQWMNSELAGQLAKRRQWRMAQSFGGDPKDGPKDEIVQLKEPVLADVYDDKHIRQLAAAVGASSQRLLKQMNRAAAQTNQEASEEEGILPWVIWLKGTIDEAFRKMGYGQYEAVPDLSTELDPLKQSEIDAQDIKVGKITINEARDRRGLMPASEPEANQLGIVTNTGWVPIAGAADRVQQSHQASLQQNPGTKEIEDGEDGEEGDAGGTKVKKKVATQIAVDPRRTSPRLAIAHAKLYTHISSFLHRSAKTAAKLVEGNATAQRLTKATKPSRPDIDEIVEAILAGLQWSELPVLIEPDLTSAASEGAEYGVQGLQALIAEAAQQPVPGGGTPLAAPKPVPVAVISSEVIAEVNQVALDYAHERAAEMVGMKWVDGELVENPNAKWAISEATRNMIREAVTKAFSQETTMDDLVQAIRQAGAFSEKRAALIARTEIANAQVGGNFAAWQKSKLVLATKWIVSNDHDVMDECDLNVDAGAVKIGEDYPSGAKHAPAHPRCCCVTVPAKIKGVEL